MRLVDNRRNNVALNGKLLDKEGCFKYLRSHVALDRHRRRNKVQNELSKKGVWRNANSTVDEGINEKSNLE